MIKPDAQIHPQEDGRARYEPKWLINGYDEDVWRLRESLPGQSRSRMTVRWEPCSSAKSGVCTGSWEYWREYAKCVSYWAMESDLGPCAAIGSLAQWARETRSVCEWLCYERALENVEAVGKSDVFAYEEYLGGLGITVSAITTKLSVLRHLWLLSGVVGKGLSFDPYFSRGEMKRTAKRLGKADKNTPTIKPYDFFCLLECALEVLDTRADGVLEKMRTYIDLQATHSKPSAGYKNRTGESAKALRREMSVCYGAAIAVIASLHGQRYHEIAGITFVDACALLKSGDDVGELRGRVHKTARTQTGKETMRAAVPEIRKAVSVIVRLTEETRKLYKGEFLLIRSPVWIGWTDDESLALDVHTVHRLLDCFAESAGFRGINLRPHMFRRAFSLLWAWRFEVGDLHYLSLLLNHNSEHVTQCYTEDSNVWEFLPEAEQSLAFDIMEKALLGQEDLWGGFSKTMKRYARLLQARVTVLYPERVEAFMESLVGKYGFRVIPNADGYCFMHSARARYARCSTDGRGPNYAMRSEELCAACPNFGVDRSRERIWEERLEAHQKVAEGTDIRLLKEAARKGVKRAQYVLAKIRGGRSDDKSK